MESHYVHKPHNVSVLMYHIVCAAKYRRVVMSEQVDEVLKDVCLEIEKRWEFWGKGYFVNTVGQHGSEKVIAEYVKRQGEGRDYHQLHKGQMEFRI
jgi:REP element-mobilizing transposase RayT